MGGMGTVPGTDYGWLAKVLAGDPVACGVLALAPARTLPSAKWNAFTLSVERINAGMPVPDVLAALGQRRGEKRPRSG